MSEVDPFDWFDPEPNPPQAPFKPRDVYVDYSPAQVTNVVSNSSPKELASLLSSSSPKPIVSVGLDTEPVGLTFIGVTDSPAPPVPFLEVDKSPKWVESTSVLSSPKNINSTEVGTDPYAPANIEPATDPYPVGSIDVDSSPRNVESVLEDFFTANDPILGLWRYDSEPSDYAILLQTSQESDSADFPDGANNEILKITKTFTQEGLYSSTTYIETQDAMLGGGEPNQVFDIDDQDILWTYVKFAAVFDPQNHTIYRELTRPPLPPVLCEHIEDTVEVESVEVEFSPTSVASLEVGELSFAITSVSVESSPKPVDLEVVAEINTGITSISVGLLPEAVSSVTPESSPKPITSVDPLSSPQDIDSAVVESTPKPLDSLVVGATPATIISVSGDSSPKPITTSEALSTPLAPASISGGTLPYAVSDISIEATPANVVSVLSTDSQPDSVATVTGGAFTIAPALVLATDSVPVAVATLDSRVIPTSIVSVDIEYTPKPVVSVVPDLKPVAPAIINSAELGDTSPLAVLVVSSPRPVAFVEELELVTPVTSVEVIATPKAVSSISIGRVPLAISTVIIETEPKPVLDVDPLIVEPMVPVATLEVVNLSVFPAAPAEVFISGLYQETPVLRVESLFVESSPKPVAGFSGGDLSEIPIAPVVMVSSFNTTDTGTGTGAPGTVPGTGPLTGGYAPSRPTAVGVQANPKNITKVEVLELAAHPPLSVEVDSSPSPVSGVLPVNNSAAPTAPEVLQVIGVIVEIIREAIPEPPQVIQITAVLYPTRYVDPPFQPSVLYADIKCDPVSFIDATDKPPTPISFLDATDSPPNAPGQFTATDNSFPPNAVDNVSVIYAYVIDGGSVIEKFYVSGGQLSEPYYNFSDQFGSPIDFDDIVLRPGRSFIFEATSGYNVNHPMTIGTFIDGGWLPLEYANGNPLSAIGDQVGFTIPEDFDPDLDNIGFFCAVHQSMNGNFPITEEPRTEGGGVGAGGSGPGGATGTIDGGGGTDTGLFDEVSIPLRIEVDTEPKKVESVTPRNISIPIEPTFVGLEIFNPASGVWSPGEEIYDSKGDDYYAWWDSNELVNGIPSWHPSVPVGDLGDGYAGSFGNTGNYLIYGSDPTDQNPDDFSTVETGGDLPNRYTIDGGFVYRDSENFLALAKHADCSDLSTSSDYDLAVSPRNMEQHFVLKLDDNEPQGTNLYAIDRGTHIIFDDDGLGMPNSVDPCPNDGETNWYLLLTRNKITVVTQRRYINSSGNLDLAMFEHSHTTTLPTYKPFILGVKRTSDLNLVNNALSETYRKLHISINGTDLFTLDLYTIPNSGETSVFWDVGTNLLHLSTMGDQRFSITSHILSGDDRESNAYVGDIVMVGQKQTSSSYSNPRIPVESVEVEVLFKTGDTKTFSKELASTYGGTKELEMIYSEPGTFIMGSPETEAGREVDETQHEVTLTQGFFLSKYEVTQAQYQAVMTGNSDGLSVTPSYWSNNADRPVEQVSWDDIQKFLTRLNAQEAGNIPAGWAYVLPTEAQWEYTCRAGTTTLRSWGDSITLANANTGDLEDDANQTEDVGNYAANPWGFFDMHGNVFEWTADWYAAYSSGAQTDPEGPATGSSRVFRGGDWASTGTNVRSADRRYTYPSNRYNGLGFRLALKQI